MSQSVSSSPSEDNTAVLPITEQYSSGDISLDVVFQQLVVALTDLPGTLVLPRWQPVEPPYPAIGTDWCAVGVTSQDGDANVATTVNNEEQVEVHRHETITLLSSFYGPNASELSSRFRDGLYLGQNRGLLESNGMRILRNGSLTRFPALINQQWQNRFDFELRLRRHTVRTYPITTVIESSGEVTDGSFSFPFDTGVIE